MRHDRTESDKTCHSSARALGLQEQHGEWHQGWQQGQGNKHVGQGGEMTEGWQDTSFLRGPDACVHELVAREEQRNGGERQLADESDLAD